MEIQNCKLCDNCIKRHNVVEGIGNKSADVMFIFDHPRFKQDKTGLFRSDDHINSFLGYLMSMGFDEFNAYYAYLVKCRPVSMYNFHRGKNICTTEHLSKEYIYEGTRKKLIVTVGDEVSNYIFNGKTYKRFHAYDLISAVIPIPNATWFVKGGAMNTNRLKFVRQFYDSIN